jgi:hypothetical protein
LAGQDLELGGGVVSGREFWAWLPVWLGAGIVGWRFFVAAWRDHDDDLDRFAIGAHRWPLPEEDDR